MVVPASLRPVRTAAALLGAALAAWIVLFALIPGTDGLWWFLGFWVTMTAAMMLPSVAPVVLLFAQVGGRTPAFLGGYLATWIAYGLAAYGLFRLFDGTSAYIGGWAIVVSGLYQLTPLKDACLRRCRSPIGYVTQRRGAFAIGAHHGLYCVGCCWALMVALLALGVMSLFWMSAVAAVIFAEKVLPRGVLLSRLVAVPLVVVGVAVALGASL